jgi:hypothetical protein
MALQLATGKACSGGSDTIVDGGMNVHLIAHENSLREG